jgi:adenylosuccinate lyase
MIPRYSRPDMTAVFAPENKLRLWLEVELCVAEAMAELGQIDRAAVARLRAETTGAMDRLIDPAAVDAIEATTRHDVIAFLTHVENVTGPEARLLHLGMTSSDLLDTTLALQLKEAGGADHGRARGACSPSSPAGPGARRRHLHRPQPRHPRRAHHHGRQARRLLRRVRPPAAALCRRHPGCLDLCISGAVGTFANIDPGSRPWWPSGSASRSSPSRPR